MRNFSGRKISRQDLAPAGGEGKGGNLDGARRTIDHRTQSVRTCSQKAIDLVCELVKTCNVEGIDLIC